MAMDAGQNLFIVGSTSSKDFPVTPGALAPTTETGGSTGFAVKLSDSGELVAATYLPFSWPVAVAIDSNGQPVIAGSGVTGPVMRLDSSLSQVLSSVSLPDQNRPNALAIDGQDNLEIFGVAPAAAIQATPGAYVSSALGLICTDTNPFFSNIDGFITKLAAADWKPIYTAHLAAPCGIHVGSMILDQSGAPVLAFGTGGGFSLRNALVGGPACSSDSSVIAKLSSDGSTLDFATYLDACGAPPLAAAPDRALYAGHNAGAGGVLRLPIPADAAIDIQQVWNAFSGDASAVVPGGLYSLAAPGSSLPTTDLGLDAKQDLPLELAGTRVTFDGTPAPILQTQPGRIIVAAPMNLYDGGRSSHYGLTRVQVWSNGSASHEVWLPVSTWGPGLLTRGFPDLPVSGFADGNVRNEDASLNDADHPALPGSTITVFATGLGAANMPFSPGAIASSSGVVPITPTYSSWQRGGPTSQPAPLVVTSVPGFVSAMFQIQIQVPDSPQVWAGYPMLANGVVRAALGLQSQVYVSSAPRIASNVIGVYVKP